MGGVLISIFNEARGFTVSFVAAAHDPVCGDYYTFKLESSTEPQLTFHFILLRQ